MCVEGGVWMCVWRVGGAVYRCECVWRGCMDVSVCGEECMDVSVCGEECMDVSVCGGGVWM